MEQKKGIYLIRFFLYLATSYLLLCNYDSFCNVITESESVDVGINKCPVVKLNNAVLE